LVCALTVAVALAATGARAEKADREKPIFYQGDSGGANLGSKDGELAGSVVITQGTLTIHADRIVFHQNPDNSLSATAYGNPVTFRESATVWTNTTKLRAAVVYNGQKRFLELFDRALLKKSGDEIRSNYITYDAAAEVFKAEGRPDSKPPDAGDVPTGPRVRGVFQPQSKEDKSAKDAKETKDGKEAAASKDGKDAKDTSSTKDAKDGKPATTPNPPPPPPQLKGDTTLAPAPANDGCARAVSTLAVEALNKRYKSRVVVHDVSLTVGSGELSGCSVEWRRQDDLLLHDRRLVATDGGRIELDGDDLAHADSRAGAIGFVVPAAGNASIFRKLSVAENVQAILELQGIDTDEIANRLDALLEDLSISHLRDNAAVSLSGGEPSRRDRARPGDAPRFILLDEPFAGIDPIAVLDIRRSSASQGRGSA
jgi:lipopolysaccharide export system ATP-binding protein